MRIRNACGIFALALVLPWVPEESSAQARARDYEIVHAFAQGLDGSWPGDGVTLDSAGNIYGTTSGGGHAGCAKGGGCGTVFKIAPDGTESILLAFDRSNGSSPYSVPFVDGAGNVYATATEGGNQHGLGHGTLVQIAPDGQATLLYSFCSAKSCEDGGSPIGKLIGDKTGDLFGVAYVGGPAEDGVIFEFASAGKYKVIYAIGEPLASGAFARDAKGNFYIATGGGGAYGGGTVIKVSRDGSGSLLHEFGASGDGSFPTGVSLDGKGNVYGFTSTGGADNAGTIFKIDVNGSETVLYSFTGADDGANPTSAPVLDKADNLYGVARAGGADDAGVFFKLASAGALTVRHDFAGSPDGAEPVGSVFLTKAGAFYGTTFYGGSEKKAACMSGGCGTVFTLNK